MAVISNSRLRRTQNGRDEVLDKTHVLTQSERMLLVLVDGVTSTEGLKQKLRGMGERRFILAIERLAAKGLLEEVAAPWNRQEKRLDTATVERFVQQGRLDPVTVSALTIQPEMLREVANGNDANEVESQINAEALPDIRASHAPAVDFFLPLEDRGPSGPGAANMQQGGISGVVITTNGTEEKPGSSRRRLRRERRGRQVQVGYWLLFAGLVCVILWVAAQRIH